jgi:hypothetical protein
MAVWQPIVAVIALHALCSVAQLPLHEEDSTAGSGSTCMGGTACGDCLDAWSVSLQLLCNGQTAAVLTPSAVRCCCAVVWCALS